MNAQWKQLVITGIRFAVYVAPGTGSSIHTNRQWHGFVLNEPGCMRDYCFDDGRVMRTAGGDLFYLPKGSSYTVKTLASGGCYAINFFADITDEPFSLQPRNYPQILQQFKTAAGGCKTGDPCWKLAGMRAVYDGVYQLQERLNGSYVPGSRVARIRPGIEMMNRDFANSELTVSRLADLCGMSEVYFRKLFQSVTGRTPKEYLIQKRIEYARSLLEAGSFSVAEVARLCGYSEPCHFSRVFSARVGVPPNRYLSGDTEPEQKEA